MGDFNTHIFISIVQNKYIKGCQKETNVVSNMAEVLKVSKSQKHFFLKLYCPKAHKILDKIGQNFVKYFVCLLGNEVLRKKVFEIY